MLLDYIQDKMNLIGKYQIHPKDSGSVFVQTALLSAKINYIQDHLKIHSKDHPAKHTLISLVRRRRKMLSEISKKSPETYDRITSDFNIRKQKKN